MKNFNVKLFVIILSAVLFAATILICFCNPEMHKLFNVNVIEYLIKINPDGSVSTTKTTTTTVLKEK